MREFLKNIFGGSAESSSPRGDSEYDLQVATAALLLEIAGVDDEFTSAEREIIVRALKRHFGLGSGEVEEILEATGEELERRIDLYYFTKKINERFDLERKIKIIELVWRVIYSDDHLDGHEDYLVHRIARLLRLDHPQMIAAKIKVKKERKNRKG